jgi:hypothetical protein
MTDDKSRPAPPPIMPYGAPITLDEAKRVAAAAEAEARRNGWSMAIAIAEPSGALVYFQKMTTPSTARPASRRRRRRPPRCSAADKGVHRRARRRPPVLPDIRRLIGRPRRPAAGGRQQAYRRHRRERRRRPPGRYRRAGRRRRDQVARLDAGARGHQAVALCCAIDVEPTALRLRQ